MPRRPDYRRAPARGARPAARRCQGAWRRPEAGVACSRLLALRPHVDELERHLIHEALLQAGGNKAAAARLLKISERALWYKIKRYGLT